MHRSHYLLLLFSSLLILPACTPFLFESPQPAGKAEASQFHPSVRGVYTAEGDTLWIEAQELTLSEGGEVIVALADLAQSQLEIRADRLYHLENGRDYAYRIKGDSLLYQATTYLTFGLSDTVIIKRDQGLYFVNLRADEGWNLYLLEAVDTGMWVRTIDVSEDLEAIQARIEVQVIKDEDGEVDYYLAAPTRSELWDLIKAGLFREETYFQSVE